ncbi:hypothetical protein G3V74_23905, partial [Escherichia coli]|nr:hypothetical protein [Escherichia coli]
KNVIDNPTHDKTFVSRYLRPGSDKTYHETSIQIIDTTSVDTDEANDVSLQVSIELDKLSRLLNIDVDVSDRTVKNRVPLHIIIADDITHPEIFHSTNMKKLAGVYSSTLNDNNSIETMFMIVNKKYVGGSHPIITHE